MDKTPLISVVMSVFNGEEYLQGAIESILAQTYTHFEFIICDDGSSDASPGILDSYRDPRIVLLKNENNLGLTKSLNRCIQISKGEYIARQDADDESLPDRLMKQVRFLANHPEFGLIGTSARYINVVTGKSFDWLPMRDPVEIQRSLFYSIPFRHGTFMIRSTCLKEIGNSYDERYPVAQDCDLLLRIADRWELSNLPEVLYIHRIHPGSITTFLQAEQEKYLEQAWLSAAHRRIAFGWKRLGLWNTGQPAWVNTVDRKWLGMRFLWWAESAKGLNKLFSLKMYVISLLLFPNQRDLWNSISGIFKRKIRMRI